MQNSLPSVKNQALGKDLLCRVLHSAKNCTRQTWALGKGLLCRVPDSLQNRYTRHRLPAKQRSVTAFFAECLLLGTRQRFDFLKKNSLPSAPDLALGKDLIFFKFFAECLRSGTRQRIFFLKKILCRVPLTRHSAKI